MHSTSNSANENHKNNEKWYEKKIICIGPYAQLHNNAYMARCASWYRNMYLYFRVPSVGNSSAPHVIPVHSFLISLSLFTGRNILGHLLKENGSCGSRSPACCTLHWCRISHGFYVDGEGSDEASHSPATVIWLGATPTLQVKGGCCWLRRGWGTAHQVGKLSRAGILSDDGDDVTTLPALRRTFCFTSSTFLRQCGVFLKLPERNKCASFKLKALHLIQANACFNPQIFLGRKGIIRKVCKLH
jgi:hypothetical protein